LVYTDWFDAIGHYAHSVYVPARKKAAFERQKGCRSFDEGVHGNVESKKEGK
jgi:hypothetical protein